MITFYPPDARFMSMQKGVTVHGLFSFDDFFDPENVHFGPVVAFNDYAAEPGCGFDWHPHQELEQFFFVYEGTMECKDSIHSEGVLSAPAMQRITTGSGYARSTLNTGGSLLRYIGVWMVPRFASLAPGMEVRQLQPFLSPNVMQPVVSGFPDRFPEVIGDVSPMVLNCDATIFLCRLEKGRKTCRPGRNGGRSALLYAVQGSVRTGNFTMDAGSHLRINGDDNPEVIAETDALLMLTELC